MMNFLYKGFYFMLFCGMVALVFVHSCSTSRENKRLKENIRTMQTTAEEYRGKYGRAVIQRNAITAERDEVKAYSQSLEKAIAELKTSRKNEVAHAIEINTLHRDSVVWRFDTIRKPVIVADTCLVYNDGWTDIRICLDPDSVSMDYSATDSVFPIIEKQYRHKFLWWRWGLKGCKVSVVNSNPKVKIHSLDYVEIQ